MLQLPRVITPHSHCFTWQGLHTSSWAAAADGSELPVGINPLQQAPPPGGAVSASAALSALPGVEEGFTARAVHRGIKMSPTKLNMFAKLIRWVGMQPTTMSLPLQHRQLALTPTAATYTDRMPALYCTRGPEAPTPLIRPASTRLDSAACTLRMR